MIAAARNNGCVNTMTIASLALARMPMLGLSSQPTPLTQAKTFVVLSDLLPPLRQ